MECLRRAGDRGCRAVARGRSAFCSAVGSVVYGPRAWAERCNLFLDVVLALADDASRSRSGQVMLAGFRRAARVLPSRYSAPAGPRPCDWEERRSDADEEAEDGAEDGGQGSDSEPGAGSLAGASTHAASFYSADEGGSVKGVPLSRQGSQEATSGDALRRRGSADHLRRASADRRLSVERRGGGPQPQPDSSGGGGGAPTFPDAQSLPAACWAEGDHSLFVLRGPDYLDDRRKIAARPPLLRLANVDLFSTPFGPPVGNLAAHPGGWLARRAAAGLPPPGFTFVFAFQNPAAGGFPPAVLALYFTPAGGESLAQLLASPTTPAPQKAALARFLQAGPLERKTMVKAVACVTAGPVLVRATVPRTPFIVGAAVPCPVHACGDSLEVDVDVAASPVGDRFYRHVVHRLAGAVTVHVALLLEGQRPGELPEHLLGCARLARVAPGLAVPLPAG